MNRSARPSRAGEVVANSWAEYNQAKFAPVDDIYAKGRPLARGSPAAEPIKVEESDDTAAHRVIREWKR